MKFMHEDITEVFEWTEIEIPTLVIESTSQFNQIVIDLYEQTIDGYEGKSSLFDDSDKDILKLSKLILEPFSLTVDNKEVQNYLTKYLLDRMKETHIDLDKDLRPIYSFINNLFLELPLDIEVEHTFNQRNLAKVFPFSIYDDSESILERIFNYTRIMTEFNLIEMFIFVNIKQYLTIQEYSTFTNYVKNEKIKVLLIEGSVGNKNEDSKYFIVDEDLCIII